jgi:hypothetical protein
MSIADERLLRFAVRLLKVGMLCKDKLSEKETWGKVGRRSFIVREFQG